MRFYLDEDIASRELTARLIAADHELVATRLGEPDTVAWAFAQEHAAVVVTQNAADFIALAATSDGHHGLVVVHRDNDARDMTPAMIADALGNLTIAMPDGVDDLVVPLNAFR